MPKIIVVMEMNAPLELTQVALSLLGSIARDLQLKRVEIQHPVSYIYKSIHMVMMKNLFLVIGPESSTKNMRKYYKIKYKISLILISLKLTIKMRENIRREYMVLDLKQNLTMDQNIRTLLRLMRQLQQHLRMLNQK